MAGKDEKIVAVTAAMPEGTGLKKFGALYPDRLFDVGIAEEHAVTFAAGMAAGGLKPVVAIYSTFLQRAYDQMLHDVCLQALPVVFAIDRAGLVGSDGETHHGIFDLSYLRSIPGMTVFAPKNKYELRSALEFAVQSGVPFAVRYPRGTAYSGLKDCQAPIEMGKSEVISEGTDVALLAVGSMVETAVQVREGLEACGISAALVNVRFVKPMDEELLGRLAGQCRLLVPMEENVKSGGFGEAVAGFAAEHGYTAQVLPVCVPDMFVEQGSVDTLKKALKLDADSVCQRIKERLK